MECRTCGAELTPGARYCERCGARVAADEEPRGSIAWQSGLSWAAAGAAIGVVITLLVMRGATNAPSQAVADLAPVRGTTDISQMSPAERATRLYNRVMRLQEEGKADSVAFFQPMALQTYAMLPGQDPDTRYHMGLLELAGGNRNGARAQADSIHQMAPSHLFAFMLRAAVARQANDQAALRQARADFRRHEQSERSRSRPEYTDHASQLDAFSVDARR